MIDLIDKFILPAAASLLPAGMDTPEARAMLLAVGLQETRFTDRVQRTPGSLRQWWVGGPARSFWQFEQGGLRGLAGHPDSGPLLRAALSALCYQADTSVADLHGLIAENDVLAAVCGRLLLRTDPKPLPIQSAGPESSWRCYERNWRPGKPRRETWDACHAEAWRRVRPAAPKAA